MRLVRWFESFVFAPEDARRLAAVRIGLFGLLAWRLAQSEAFERVADQPPALFDPVSLFHLLSEMPSGGVASALQIAGVLAAIAAAAGLFPRLSFPVAFAAAVFLNLMLNSTGKIIHNDVVLILCLIPIVVSPGPATAAWSLGRLRRSRTPEEAQRGTAYGWPIRTAMVVIALAYLFVGLQKLRYSGIDWATTENLRWVLLAASDSMSEPNELAIFIADRAWMVHIFAAGTLALEIGFALCLPFARLRWLFVPGVVSMHIGISATMGLDYSAQFLAVVIVFVNWVALVDLLNKRRVGEFGWARSRPHGAGGG